jgi:radical SAM superfamily enzyme YgiQ (UPF0313 family)
MKDLKNIGIGVEMKILLVNPPNSGRSIPEEEYGIENIKMIFRGEPLALETLAGNLDGHDVCVADLKADPESLQKNIDEFQPDISGITGMTCEANAMLDIARTLKNVSGAIVVAGGHHASCDPEFFNRECIDYVVSGLGKLSFRELVDALEAGRPADIPGIGKTDPSRPLCFTPRDYSNKDLVDHKAPRYDLVQKNRDKYVMSGVGGKMGFVVSAFGCVHRCFFCSIPNITRGKYLSHSVQAIIRDMKTLEDMPVLRLVDANTFGDIGAAENLGRGILASGLKKRMVADVRSDTVVRHPDLFRLWKEAGLETAVIGFEEVSDERLKNYNKKNAVRTNIAAIDILKSFGIKIIGDFIVSPDYDDKDFHALENFVNSHAIDLPLPSILTPIPGTPLYQKLKDKITVHNLDYYTFTNAVMQTRMAEKEFYEMYSTMLNRFIAHVRHSEK